MISGSVIHGHYICPTDWVHQRSRGSPTTFWSTTVPSSDTNSSTPRLGRGWPGARLGPAWPGSKHVKTLVQPGEPQKRGVNINIYIYTHGYINDYTWWVYKWRKINHPSKSCEDLILYWSVCRKIWKGSFGAGIVSLLIARIRWLSTWVIAMMKGSLRAVAQIRGIIRRVSKVMPRLVGIVKNSLGALDFQNSCFFVNCIGNAWFSGFHAWIYDSLQILRWGGVWHVSWKLHIWVT